MADRSRTNFVTGLFLVLVVAATIAMLLFFQGYRATEDGDVYYLVFDSAPKIKVTSPVEVGGRRVGKVEEVAIEQLSGGEEHNYALVTQVVLRVRIEPEFRSSLSFYRNAYAEVIPSLFGGSAVSIVPGGEGAGSASAGVPQKLVPGAQREVRNTIPGVSSPTLNDVIASAKETSDNAAAVIARVREILSDDGTIEDLKAAISSITETMESVSRIMRDKIEPMMDRDFEAMMADSRKLMASANEMLDANRENITQITENMRVISDHAAAFSEDKLAEIAERLSSVLARIDEMAENINGVLIDNRGNIDQSMANLRQATSEMSALMTKLRRDPSILAWGTDADDNAADVDPGARAKIDEKKLRDRGHLPPQERD